MRTGLLFLIRMTKQGTASRLPVPVVLDLVSQLRVACRQNHHHKRPLLPRLLRPSKYVGTAVLSQNPVKNSAATAEPRSLLRHPPSRLPPLQYARPVGVRSGPVRHSVRNAAEKLPEPFLFRSLFLLKRTREITVRFCQVFVLVIPPALLQNIPLVIDRNVSGDVCDFIGRPSV